LCASKAARSRRTRPPVAVIRPAWPPCWKNTRNNFRKAPFPVSPRGKPGWGRGAPKPPKNRRLPRTRGVSKHFAETPLVIPHRQTRALQRAPKGSQKKKALKIRRVARPTSAGQGTQAHNISSRQKEDRGGTACEVGEGEGGQEKLYLKRPASSGIS